MFRSFYRRHLFTVVVVGCILFIALTTIAMFFYPGGTATDATTRGYSFFENFFSDLGRTESRTGEANTVAAVLFLVALTLAGSGLGLFFAAFPQFFWQMWPGRVLSILGSLFGLGAAISFVGVAFTPANLSVGAHGQFVIWAFRLFPLAVLCYTPAMFLEKGFPRRYAWYFLGFLALLVGYYQLLMNGPGFGTYEGLVIQAVGQKVIVYASIVSILIQALGARKGRFSSTLERGERGGEAAMLT
jgi:hypothetical protein